MKKLLLLLAISFGSHAETTKIHIDEAKGVTITTTDGVPSLEAKEEGVEIISDNSFMVGKELYTSLERNTLTSDSLLTKTVKDSYVDQYGNVFKWNGSVPKDGLATKTEVTKFVRKLDWYTLEYRGPSKTIFTQFRTLNLFSPIFDDINNHEVYLVDGEYLEVDGSDYGWSFRFLFWLINVFSLFRMLLKDEQSSDNCIEAGGILVLPLFAASMFLPATWLFWFTMIFASFIDHCVSGE